METNQHTDLEQLFGLTGKVAIVTGAAGGIGWSIAQLFARVGATVVAADRDQAGLNRVMQGCALPGVTYITFDQADPASIEDMVQSVARQHGQLDVIVNCAAAFGMKKFEVLDASDWDRIQAVNLKGVAFCCKSALAVMAPRASGAIINISSVAATRVVLYDNLAYTTAKAGCIALTRTLALEYASRGIRINGVIPGAIRNENPELHQQTAMALRGPLLEPGYIPMGDFGYPRDIAAACLYLAGDASRYMTGQSLTVDGGIMVG